MTAAGIESSDLSHARRPIAATASAASPMMGPASWPYMASAAAVAAAAAAAAAAGGGGQPGAGLRLGRGPELMRRLCAMNQQFATSVMEDYIRPIGKFEKAILPKGLRNLLT